jgi:Caspase domain
MAGRRKALIVASDEYEHEGLRRLLAPAADAEALRRVLGDPQIGAFEVRVVHNESAHVVQQQIEDVFSEAGRDDVLLLHFSCHGLKSESGELFFAARNTRPDRLASTAISADFVQRCMRASRSRSIVLLLDCCYGGAFARGVTVRASADLHVLDSFPSEKLGGGRGRAVITASSAMEYAFEAGELAEDHSRGPSVFTTAVVEGLTTGDADRDEDGWVSLDELYDYVFDRVREGNPYQTPSCDVEIQGELYVARSRRTRIRALPIPPDLEAARGDPNIFTRLGAIGELRTRLASDDLEAALGARDALADTARTDIPYVAERANAALDEAAVQLDETELQLGRIEQGSAAPHRTVRLLGPPIARACVARASHDWIRVEQTTDALDISVDTAAVGRFRGSVEVKGPTGQAGIPIEVELVPRALRTESAPRPDVEPAEGAAPSPTVAAATSSDDVRPAAGGPAETTPAETTTGDATPIGGRAARMGRQRHRRFVYAGAAVTLAVAVGVVGLLILDRGGGDPPAKPGHPAHAAFTAKAPWRLVISDKISGDDSGCTVTVTNTATKEKKVLKNYGTKSFQMQDSGNFQWEANNSECLVIQRPGHGKAVLPFVQEYATGDTDAFHAPGRITVNVLDFNGGDSCDLVLSDATDGRPVDFGTASKGGSPLVLDPNGRSEVYLTDLECSVRVSTA